MAARRPSRARSSSTPRAAAGARGTAAPRGQAKKKRKQTKKKPPATIATSQAPLTYAGSGVDIEAGNAFVRRIARTVGSTHGPRVLDNELGFAGLFSLDYDERLFKRNYRRPILVAGTDGVGTKLNVAIDADRHDTIGIDLVAMSVNDCLVVGAEPLFFLDYIACARLEPRTLAAVVEGIAEGCRQADCALLGGETAEMPGLYAPGTYDLAGFAVGVCEKARLVKPARVAVGDLAIGLPSAGLHSNGYSLARRALLEAGGFTLDTTIAELGGPLGDALLEPTRIYVKPIVNLCRAYRRQYVPHAMAHITGGGLVENLPRVLPAGTRIVLDPKTWERPPIFEIIQRAGRIAEDEMRRVFNLGLGFVLLVPEANADAVLGRLARDGEPARIVGHVVRAHRAPDVRFEAGAV